jgi:hypothetical protein
MTMAILECRSVLLRIVGKSKVGLATCVAFALLIIAASSPPVRAESAPPEARAAKPGPQARKPRDTAAESAQTTKPTTAKAKPRPRAVPKAAKPRAVPAAKSTPAPAAKEPAASAKPTQVMDFDNDQVEGQRLEPGFELIQAAPRRARQPSLVTPLRPEDSVVGR